MAPTTSNGIINTSSNHPVDQTVEKLKGILQAKGVTVFALVDHSGEAEKVGMKMRPTKLLHLRQPQGGHAANAGRAQRGPRPSPQDSRLGGWTGESMAFL